ncbi:DNA-3-methyladenine glycosylase family protein [Calidithermus timidus]|jgi:DNA-3-methyladenine glycosylase II|uniref:DNA-3-methyladenine glycosylase family protein n=1 Tax=Calidithermus timidus TaxID=307124 RepID=UPI00036A8137|nr:DNA-3-methyladenine glycosylase [Calidithermus timidus]
MAVTNGTVEFGDPLMAELQRRFGPAPFQPHAAEVRPAYSTLVSSIVGQQLSGKAAQTIWKRLEQRFPIEPAALAAAHPDDLRALGLSRAKASFVHDLSRFALGGGLEGLEHRSDQAIIAHLTQVKGIGVWTVQMFLMFGLRRPDVWPILDLGVRRGLERVYGVSTKAELEALGERFRPFRSHAAWYMWRVVEGSGV